MARIAIVLPAATYRAADFLDAAKRLRADVVVASNAAHTMAGVMGDHFVAVDPERPEWSAERVVDLATRLPLDAVVAADDQGVLIAALAAERLGLRHNPPGSVEATRDKAAMRKTLAGAVTQPRYGVAGIGEVATMASSIGFPAVVKPVSLSASRGVLRVDDGDGAAAAEARIRGILAEAGCDPGESLLVEAFVPGGEVALEGLLMDGRLETLALFDKPDPLEGPVFEETILVSPSRLPREVQATVQTTAADAARALGLREGPIHAEFRVDGHRVTVLEVAARSIGGLCGRALRFGLLDATLETVLLRHALGYPTADLARRSPAAGAMMLPIPGEGTLRAVHGVEAARAVPGVVDLEITIPIGHRVRPLPEADRYLGFLMAHGDSAESAEAALRSAHAELSFVIE